MGKEISRRSFLGKGALAAGVGASAMLLAGCQNQATAEVAASESWMPEWQEETDVVICGYGAAGIAAAISALDAGVPSIVFEKSPIEDGGNFGCSAGIIHTNIQVDDAQEQKEKVIRGSFNAVPNTEAIEAMIDNMQDTYPWVTENLGLKLVRTEDSPNIKRSGGGRFVLDTGNPELTGSGVDLFGAMTAIAHERGVDVRLDSRVTDLVQHPVSKEILGVVVTQGNGNTLTVKARKGVLICTGSYENSRDKQYWYNHPGIFQYPWGTPHNTGDGLDLCTAAGAALWHLTANEYGNFGLLKPTEEAGTAVCLQFTGLEPYNYVIVNRYGQRFMDDSSSLTHYNAHKPILEFDRAAVNYQNIPFFLVFDSTVFEAGPIYFDNFLQGSGPYTYASVHDTIDWGPDNTKALANGWIVSDDTLAGLAAKIQTIDPATNEDVTVDGATLEATVATYNGYATSGTDPDFARRAERMAPISTPPYYAIELCLSCINIQGGPWHNGSSQTLNTKGEVIPRLYNCGECGSLNSFEYVVGNISESLTSGRVALTHAAGLEPWDA